MKIPHDNLGQEFGQYDREWYEKASEKFVGISDVLTHKPIFVLEDLAQRAQAQEIPSNDILDFIDPRFKGNIQGHSFLGTLGYFLDQRARGYAERFGLDNRATIERLQNIDKKRLAIISAVGGKNPYVRSAKGPIYLTPELGSQTGSDQDPLEAYVEKVHELFDYLTSGFDKQMIKAFLTFELEDYREIAETGMYKGKKLPDSNLKRIQAHIPTLERAIQYHAK